MVRWAAEIEVRRGKRIAVVALARKMAGIMYAIWRDGTTYEPRRGAKSSSSTEPTTIEGVLREAGRFRRRQAQGA